MKKTKISILLFSFVIALKCADKVVIHNNLYFPEQCTFYSSENYHRYLEEIKEVSIPAYERLLTCEKVTGIPCILRSEEKITKIIFADFMTFKIPFWISFDREKISKDKLLKYYSSMSKMYLDFYTDEAWENLIASVKKERMRQIVWRALSNIAPELIQTYESVSNNPVEDFIVIHSKERNMVIGLDKKTYLPHIEISADYVGFFSEEEIEAVIGHELSHYVLGHCTAKKSHQISHKQLEREVNGPGVMNRYGNLFFENGFKSAFGRIQESEADKEALLIFRVSFEATLSYMKKEAEEEKEADRKKKKYIKELIEQGSKQLIQDDDPRLIEALRAMGKKVLAIDHPSWLLRLEQLHQLKKELELVRMHHTPRSVFDWKALAEKYSTGDWAVKDF